MKHKDVVEIVRADLEAAHSLAWNTFKAQSPDPIAVARIAELIAVERRYQEGKTGQAIRKAI